MDNFLIKRVNNNILPPGFVSLIALIWSLTSACTPLVPKHETILQKELTSSEICRQIAAYNRSLATKTECMNAVVFSFRGRSIVSLGPLKLDASKNAFSMAALNPMGMRLFQVEVSEGSVKNAYVIPQFQEMKNAVTAIKTDIQRIYFDRRIPLNDKGGGSGIFDRVLPDHWIMKVEKKAVLLEFPGRFATDTVQCKKNDGDSNITRVANIMDAADESGATDETDGAEGLYRYRFSGTPLRLISKSFYKNGHTVWSADYYNYLTDSNGRSFPWKTFFKHYEYRYTLAITTKKMKK